MTETGPGEPCRNRPTAAALRRQPAITAAQIAEPFGEGSTSLGTNGARRSAAGDSDHGRVADTDRRAAASWAWCDRTNSAAWSGYSVRW